MRIIFLNIWQGNIWDKLQDFIEGQSKLTDIFCFQEVSPSNFSMIQSVLSGFDGYQACRDKPRRDGPWYGQATFIRKNIKVLSSGKVVIFGKQSNKPGFMLYENIKTDKGSFWIGNIHGKSLPGNKFDTEVRLKQSQVIVDFFKDKNPVIFGGDFNLLPDTRSIGSFEEHYGNLIKDYKIKRTRNSIAWKHLGHGKTRFVKQLFADYAFVSSGIKVKNFAVPDLTVSDHLPLILDFELQ